MIRPRNSPLPAPTYPSESFAFVERDADVLNRPDSADDYDEPRFIEDDDVNYSRSAQLEELLDYSDCASRAHEEGWFYSDDDPD